MSARMRSRALVLVGLLAPWSMPSVRADPILYSTSGTVDIANEPDHQLHGVSGVAAVPDIAGNFALGAVTIIPADGWHYTFATPSVSDTPFDIHIAFDGNLPSLEIKGVLNYGAYVDKTGFLNFDFEGKVTSVASSDPTLNPALPAPFVDATSDPSVLKLHMGVWDWGVSELRISLSSQEFQAVPEPSTLVVFGAVAILAVGYARSKRAPR